MLHTDPFALLSDFERQLDQVTRPVAARSGWLPAADVIAGEHDIRVMLDAPGISREDLAIEVRDGALIVTGERKPVDVSGSTAQRIERGWGRWSRTMPLRDDVVTDDIKADLTDGVLTITLPIAEAAKPRRIEIGASSRGRLQAAD